MTPGDALNTPPLVPEGQEVQQSEPLLLAIADAEAARKQEYPEDFLAQLEAQDPELYDRLSKLDSASVENLQGAVADLDAALAEWEASGVAGSTELAAGGPVDLATQLVALKEKIGNGFDAYLVSEGKIRIDSYDANPVYVELRADGKFHIGEKLVYEKAENAISDAVYMQDCEDFACGVMIEKDCLNKPFYTIGSFVRISRDFSPNTISIFRKTHGTGGKMLQDYETGAKSEDIAELLNTRWEERFLVGESVPDDRKDVFNERRMELNNLRDNTFPAFIETFVSPDEIKIESHGSKEMTLKYVGDKWIIDGQAELSYSELGDAVMDVVLMQDIESQLRQDTVEEGWDQNPFYAAFLGGEISAHTKGNDLDVDRGFFFVGFSRDNVPTKALAGYLNGRWKDGKGVRSKEQFVSSVPTPSAVQEAVVTPPVVASDVAPDGSSVPTIPEEVVTEPADDSTVVEPVITTTAADGSSADGGGDDSQGVAVESTESTSEKDSLSYVVKDEFRVDWNQDPGKAFAIIKVINNELDLTRDPNTPLTKDERKEIADKKTEIDAKIAALTPEDFKASLNWYAGFSSTDQAWVTELRAKEQEIAASKSSAVGEEIREEKRNPLSHDESLNVLDKLAHFGLKAREHGSFKEKIERNFKKKYKREYGDHLQIELTSLTVEKGRAVIRFGVHGEKGGYSGFMLKGFEGSGASQQADGSPLSIMGQEIKNNEANREAVHDLFRGSLFNGIFESKVLDETNAGVTGPEAERQAAILTRLTEYVRHTYLDDDKETHRDQKRAAKYAGFKNRHAADEALLANWSELMSSDFLTRDEKEKLKERGPRN